MKEIRKQVNLQSLLFLSFAPEHDHCSLIITRLFSLFHFIHPYTFHCYLQTQKTNETKTKTAFLFLVLFLQQPRKPFLMQNPPIDSKRSFMMMKHVMMTLLMMKNAADV
jgi:hypothetical protein